MSNYYGDFGVNATVYMDFDSFAASTGAPSATSNFAAGDIQIYKDGGTTQRSSSAGITVSTSFDSQTGLQMVAIDLSDNTDAGFYAAGHEYNVAVADVTIDSQTVRFWLGCFSIERANGALARLKAVPTVDATKINGDATSAANLAKTTRAIGRGTVTSGSSTTSIVTSAFTPAGVEADQFKGRIITFDADTTTTALRGQSTDITANTSASAPTFTVSALTHTPASGDTFSVT